MLLCLGILEGADQLAEGVAQGRALTVHVGGLLIALQQGQAENDPPCGGDQECHHHGAAHGHAEAVAEQHQHQTDHKRHHGADVAEGITQRGDVVHPLIGGDLGQHGVIEYDAGMEADLCQNEDTQEPQPVGGDAEAGAGDASQKNRQKEDGLLELPVGEGAADGSDNGHKDGGDGAGVTPVAEVHILVDTGGTGQRIEVDRDQGGHQQSKGGVADVVEDPVAFKGSELGLFHGHSSFCVY